jgi:hypothetical protein
MFAQEMFMSIKNNANEILNQPFDPTAAATEIAAGRPPKLRIPWHRSCKFRDIATAFAVALTMPG